MCLDKGPALHRVHFELTDSTSTQARRLAMAHPGEVLVVTADQQMAGRGRQGRRWYSPRGGVWLSLAWPTRSAPSSPAGISLAAALATLEAIAEAAPQCAARLQVKWPNDVLVDGRKVAGILGEHFPGEGGLNPTLIVGVGVNVDFEPSELGADLRHPATTLRTAVGHSPTVAAVTNAVVRCLADALAEFEHAGLDDSLLAKVRSKLAYCNTTQRFEHAGGVTVGRVAGVDSAGRLVISCEGRELAFESGELVSGAPE
jgi:BirA family biotin operon repressor/biotin-[acetyl-CoA-carboxylase] ligase